MKAAHHRGSYHVRSAAIRAAANRNPETQCWRCGLTLAQHQPDSNGKPARWTAGHVIDGQVEGELRPEANTCNSRAGAAARNGASIGPTTRRW